LSNEEDVEKERLLAEINSIESEVNSIEARLDEPFKTFSYIDSMSTSLPARLKAIRDRGYIFKAYLDKQVSEIFDKWNKVREDYKNRIDYMIRDYRFKIAGLKDRCRDIRRNIEDGYKPYTQLSLLRNEAEGLKEIINRSVESILTGLKEIDRIVRNIDIEISVAERALNEISKASFKLYEDENIVECFDAKLLDKEKRKGIIYFTDRRFLFEGFKEIVLEKKFFIVTKKKIVRETLVNVPIGYIDNIASGKVGFWARKGIYVNFKQGPYKQLVFDLKDHIIPRVIKTFNYIISGEIDRDKVAKTEKKPEEGEKIPIVIKCPECGAPIKREIYRGEKTIKCEYCGAVIRL